MQDRNDLFRESARDRLERLCLGAAWALMPERIGCLPSLARLHLRDLFTRQTGLPDPRAPGGNALGICGIARDLSVPTLLAAYERGIFPGGHISPPKWFSPAERSLLFFQNFYMEKSLRRLMRKNSYRITFDRAFEQVIKTCAGRRPGKWHVTWITPKIMHAYAALHDAGHAHSYEIWNEADELAGGGYGVALGGAFFGESQFAAERNASKIAQAALFWHLDRWGFSFADSKWASPLLERMGFSCISRDEFHPLLKSTIEARAKTGPWTVEANIGHIADWMPGAKARAA